MVSCPICNIGVSEDWDYCFYCGAELIQVQETSRTFAYDQLFELMKLEGNRTALLDSKASTYSGLLGIALTILTAFGGVITIRGFELHDIKTQQPIPTASLIIIFSLYVFTVLSFIIGAIYAFKAYNLGSINLSSFGQQAEESNLPINQVDRLNKLWKSKIFEPFRIIMRDRVKSGYFVKIRRKFSTTAPPQVGKTCYYTMDFDFLADNCDQKLVQTKKKLIPHLRGVIFNNYDVNNQKSNKINKAHTSTLFGISWLILLIAFIGLSGIGIL